MKKKILQLLGMVLFVGLLAGCAAGGIVDLGINFDDNK